jgi:predicted amidohydrolase
MRIGVVQHDIVWEDREANYARLAPQVARAAAAGAELVLLSETFSTGFSMTPGIGEPEDGPSAGFLRAQAAEHGVWVAGSCPEIAPGEELPYNSLVLAGSDGTVHRYRKLHPFSATSAARRRSACRSAACGSRRSSATTCASPTPSGARRRPPTSTW